MPPPVYQLNHPPHPFWDFVQEMNGHPGWGGARRHFPPSPPPPPPQHESHEQPNGSPATANEKTTADDPPEVDPSTLKGEDCKHQRRCARRCGREQRGGFWEGGPRRGGWPAFGPPPFTMAGPHQHPPPPFGFHGRGGHHHHHRGGHPFHRGGPRGHHGDHHGHHHGPPPPASNPGFDLGKFLNDLGDRIGVNLNGAAEGLGLDRFMPSTSNPEVDFEPKVDIFDLSDQFVIHASLPGAKKDDVGVDWDGEHSLLRLAGVVHRPEVDEIALQHLAVDGRKREVGVFEKSIRLGTAKDPASIDVAGIKAKMSDGVLIIRVPKVEKVHHKRDVPISTATPSPPKYETSHYEDFEMYDAAPSPSPFDRPFVQREKQAAPASRTVSVEPTPPVTKPETPVLAGNEKQKEAETAPEKQQPQVQEKSVHYEESESESDDFMSDEEGEYVKINVE